MKPPLVYIETSIPSFHEDARPTPDIVVRRDWTRRWWTASTSRYRLVSSAAVIEELQRGRADHAQARLALMADLRILPIEPAIGEIVEAYIRHRLMPANPAGDALHLAIASYHKCDFLLTWNCAHLANANKFGHIRRINMLLGLYTPTLTTPLELLEADNETGEDA